MPGNPFTPAIELFRMIDPPVIHERQSLLYCKQSPANVDVKRIIKTFLGNGAERVVKLANTGASKDDVDTALLFF